MYFLAQCFELCSDFIYSKKVSDEKLEYDSKFLLFSKPF